MESEKQPELIPQETDVAAETAPKKKFKLRWLWRSLALLLALFIALFAFLVTQKGQHTALNLAAKWVNGLSIDTVEGSLQEGLTLKSARYQTAGVDVELGQADLQLGFRCLWEKRACVEHIALRDTSVTVDTSKLPERKQEEERERGEFNLPLAVQLQQLSLDNINVKVDELDISLSHFHSGLEGEGKELKLHPTELRGLTVSLAPQAVETAQKSAKTTEKGIDWSALEAQLAKPLLNKLEPITLPLNLTVSDFRASDITIEQKVKNSAGELDKPNSIIQVKSVELKGQSDSKTVQLDTFEVQSDKGNFSGKGRLTLAENYPLEWQLRGDSPAFQELKLPASQAELSVSGELFGETALKAKINGLANAELVGAVQLSEPKTPFRLQLKGEHFSYPFAKGLEPLNLKGVDLTLSGDLLAYQLKAKGVVSGMSIPASQVELSGQGSLRAFDLSELQLNALNGKANLSGKVDWSNGVEWQSKANLQNVNTKSLLPTWPAQLSGVLQSSGYAGRGKENSEWAVNVNGMDIHGQLFDKKLQLKGDLTSDFNTLLNVPNAQLIYGENEIALKGILGEKSDFSAQINAPNLKGLVPNLQAGIKGNVVMQGKLAEPKLDLDLTANNVAYGDVKLQNLTAKGKITTEKQIEADLILGLNRFSAGEFKLNNANLTLQGNENNHRLKLSSKGEPVAGNLQISGKFDRSQQVWQGQLSDVALQSPIGLFQTDKAVQVSYQNKQVKASVSAHCWRNPTLNLCFPQSFDAGQEGKVPFDIKQFDLATLQPYLDKSTQLRGMVSAKGDIAWFKNQSPQVNVELHSNRLSFEQKLESSRFPLVLSPLRLNAKLADNQLTLKTDLTVDNNGRLTSELRVADIANKRQLSGNIDIDRLNINILKPLLSNGEMIDGNVTARLSMGGTALSPQLFGNLNLSGLKATSNAMPFDVIGGGLNVKFNGASSTLNGAVQTKESTLYLDGDANWQRLDAWHSRINARANKFRLDIPGIAKVDVSPDIEVKITPKALALGGKIDVPWARIEVQELPESAVSVSSDEVIMDGSAKKKKAFVPPILTNKNAAQNGQGMAIHGDVAIHIGDDVRLDAYGLKTNLNGILKVRQGNKGLGLYGQVNLKNGTFASFGQDLLIRKGLVSFTGLPSQPTLDIEAIRNPEAMEDPSVTAGVKVTGIADSLSVNVFSNPSMSQDQALSYILTGRALDTGGDGGSSNSVAAALIGMSLSKSSKTVGKIGSAFGISDFSVSTAGIGDNTKVVVSGSLSPRFKVKYGVGLFAPLAELTLRYRLAPSLYLQSVSSINQAIDLLYRFEFD